MKIRYTKHALEMLKLRKIEKSSVENCLKNPDIKIPGKSIAKIYLKRLGNKYLKVVAVKNKEIIIITCHWLATSRIKE
ncbi:hypothetical protein A2630_01245 [Candidatus Woesebacteria bacterium RIFCSPHIGHO2_01_FULL_44_10]|uniref:DUF4258 domain-containing protein n=1 Tax=Candidatus Woesebacteria bacterium RIFCSPLOWO2_01_FULL_44_14 TaxID=1802525 RepID=A0A1F8C2T0_9BACT|nr:MAG: hypothetical protein A2630_01245 [Candidatus Woesebacteria bacterium RIFCSPHIGHO2_01_FULL_44_10]OGM54689.1 MAG: hypothetical protein A3F62_02690 [Candidatus Woesebacteria bacterium RIFCSPHIGHO2_12_FULL_44_11]OGM70159.1 MAG: hypothetical protein A2975_03730 [Candidatus Woesebacteria bacterium RIFCSPLOWO2_01_FULL_44_14]